MPYQRALAVSAAGLSTSTRQDRHDKVDQMHDFYSASMLDIEYLLNSAALAGGYINVHQKIPTLDMDGKLSPLAS